MSSLLLQGKRAVVFGAGGTMHAIDLSLEQVLGAEGARSSIWLEVRSDDPAALNARIMKFGVHRIENPDADHLYFHVRPATQRCARV